MPIRGIRKGAMLDDETATEELLVFGYSCKLFRDDDKATYIDQGKHLIPWMGNAGHMIDRYDGRGYIHELREYEPVAGHDPWEQLSPDERHVESICDQERYAALRGDLVETDSYHEEEIKRLKASLDDDGVYNQVGFSYDGSATAARAASEITNEDSNSMPGIAEEAFVPAKELNVPTDMQVPDSSKANAIVERTAMFVVRQGAQMEILIKAKQAANPQFAFLAFDHPLNPYYKHVVQMVKQGKYIPKPPTEPNDSSDEDDDEGHYLHPSLMATKEEELTVPKLNYTWTSDDPYSLLVSRLKDKVEMDAKLNIPFPPPPPPALPPPPPPPQQPADVHLAQGSAVGPPPPPPPPGLEPVTLPVEDEGVVVNDGSIDASVQIVWPPPDVVPIVDKMASYVAKNGEHFEAVVRSKSLDARFAFLNPGHPYHAYYLLKRKQFIKEGPKPSSSSRKGNSKSELPESAMTEDDSSQDVELKAGSTAAVVSFSIKMKEGGEKRRTFADSIDGSLVSTSPLTITKISELQQQPPKELTEDEKRLKAKLEEARQAEKRIRDKLAAAARERLAQVSREKQLQLERKRKAALFLTMLRRDKDADGNQDADGAGMIGPRLPTTVEMTQMIMREDSPPILALVAAQVESMSAAPSTAPKATKSTAGADGHTQMERRRSKSPSRRSSGRRHHHQESSKSRRRGSRRRSESRGRRDGGRGREDRKDARETSNRKSSRSPRPSRLSKEDREQLGRKRRRSKSPPAAYSTTSSASKRRSSRSPHRHHSRGERHKSSPQKKKKKASTSRSRHKSGSRSRSRRKDRGRKSSTSRSGSTSSSSSSSTSSSVGATSTVSMQSSLSVVSCATITSSSSDDKCSTKTANNKPTDKSKISEHRSKTSEISESKKGSSESKGKSKPPTSKPGRDGSPVTPKATKKR